MKKRRKEFMVTIKVKWRTSDGIFALEDLHALLQKLNNELEATEKGKFEAGTTGATFTAK